MQTKKASVLFLFLVVLLAASFMIEEETRSSFNGDGGESNYSSEKEVVAYYFYGEGCPHCKRVEPFISQVEQEHSLTVHKYEIYQQRNNVALLNQYFDVHSVPTNRRGIPAVFVSDFFLVGDEPILSKFEEVIGEVIEQDSLVAHASELEVDTPEDLVEKNSCSESTGNSECLSVATVTIAALIDSVSPCSLAVLLFLVGVRPLVQDRRKRALKVSLAFTFSVFLTYTLFGLGLLSVVGITGLSSVFGVAAGLIAILVGMFYIKDYLLRGSGSVIEVPRSMRPVINKMIKGVTNPLGAFLIGFAVCCFELPCTGGPYLFILGQLANTATRLQTIPMLLYYNVLFVIPLLLISLFLYFGCFSLKKATEWNERNKGLLRLVSGVTITVLGFVVIPSSELVGMTHLFLSSCKVILPPVLLMLSFFIALPFLKIHQTRAKLLSKMMLLATLLVLGLFAFPQLTGNTTANATANAAEPNTVLTTTESSSERTSDATSTQADAEKLCDTSDDACERPDEFVESNPNSVLKSEKTRELTAEELAELEERAKLYDDETANEVTAQESENNGQGPTTCDGTSPGMGNPAAIHCIELGYEYKRVVTDNGEHGACKFPDDSECEAWQFLMGKCGQEHSYCAKQGYELKVKTDGKDPFSKEYAACVHNGQEVGSVTDLFGLSQKATVGIVLTDSENEKANDESPVVLQVPSTFDWRNYDGQNWITSVKDQNPCGSCWAFSAVGVTEALYNIYTGNPDLDLDLSEEYLVSDCDTTSGTCCGGSKNQALEYIRDNGITDESCFPYVDSGCSCPGPPYVCAVGCTYRTGGECSDATCSDRCSDWQKRLTKIDVVTKITAGDSAAMKERLIDKGPLAVSYGSGNAFGGWWDGDIYRCTNDTGTNHAVVLVGYNDTGGYWIIKNSWGDTWGPHGDGYLKLGYGECYIEQKAYYAEPDRKTCGETITSNTVLVNQLSCPGNGLIIGTSGITLDCQARPRAHWIQGSGSGVGIDIEYNYVTITNCLVRDFANGIYLHDVADHNTLTDNWVYSNEFHGIYLNNAWWNYIAYNDATYNGMNGLYFHDLSKYNDVIDNNLWYNGNHGIQLKGTSDYNDFSANYFYTNGWSGMGIDTDNNLIQDSTSRDNLFHGFDIRSTTGNRLIHNWIWYNDQYGIYLYNSTNTQITDDHILGNVYHGIYSSHSNYTTIEVSQFDSNQRIGVYLHYSNHNTIQTSYFHQNHNQSIYLNYADNNFILYNDIQLSGTAGIDVRSSNNNVIQFNDVTDSANMGIYLYQSGNNDVWSNYLDNNDDWSVYVLSSDFNDFRHNIVNHPIDYGLFSSTSYNTVFQNNTVCGYSWDFYAPTSTYTADENTCDQAYQFVDSGQPDACDFRCSGCRRLEDDLYAYRDLMFCPGTYSIQDLGSLGVVRAEADGITLTCNNTVLDGVTGTGFGIYIFDHSYVTVDSCVIQNFERGVLLTGEANHNSLTNNEITSNSFAGVHILTSEYNSFAGNTISFNDLGIRLFDANYTDVSDNLIESNDYGIYMLSDSSNNFIHENTVCANTVRDLYDDLTGLSNTGDLNYCDTTIGYVDSGQTSGCDFECSGCRKAEDNLYISEDTVLCPYTYNLEDVGSFGVIIIGAHGVELDCQGAELIGVITGSGYGIRNPGYDYVTVRNCNVHNYWLGIAFEADSDYATIANNDVSSNSGGLRLWTSDLGEITGNIANLNTQYGIILTMSSQYNVVRNNVVEENIMGGVAIYSSNGNLVELNSITGNDYGIYVYDSESNYVINNIVENNIGTGVFFTPSSAKGNQLIHNRVCGNALDIMDDDANSGDDNFCGTTSNWDDAGTTGCTFSCFFGDIQGDAPGTLPDGDVDYFDFLAFAASYLTTGAHPNYNPGADFDVDGDVDYDDFLIFAGNYLKTSSSMLSIPESLKNTRLRI